MFKLQNCLYLSKDSNEDHKTVYTYRKTPTKPIDIHNYLLIGFFMTNCYFDQNSSSSSSHEKIHKKSRYPEEFIPSPSYFSYLQCGVLHLLTVSSFTYFQFHGLTLEILNGLWLRLISICVNCILIR